MRTNYNVTITYSSKQPTARERISLKDTSLAQSLDELTKSTGEQTINLDYYVKLSIHNEKARDAQDYNKIVFVDTDGNRYISGSTTLIDSFEEIYNELAEEGETNFEFTVIRQHSKNYQGKDFLKAILR